MTAQDETSPLPEFLGTYQLLREIGAGGGARVFRARHIHPSFSGRRFAVKVLHRHADAPEQVALFQQEAYLLSTLTHPNIVETIEAGIQDGRMFIAMELVEGRDLHRLLEANRAQQRQLSLALSLHIVGEVLKGLAYAHTRDGPDGRPHNLVHRDVNPQNIFLSHAGEVKLGDFGVAALAAVGDADGGLLVGKPGYFAPEQLRGEVPDARADLFALAVVMYELFCGELLFATGSLRTLLRQNLRAKVPRPRKLNPTLPPRLEEVMLQAIDRRPDKRFANALAMREALQPLLPPPEAMALGVNAALSHAFGSERLHEAQMRRRLALRTTPSQPVALLCSRDAAIRDGVGELLECNGFLLCRCDDVRAAPQRDVAVALVEVDQLLDAAKELAGVPLVVLADALSAEVCTRAHNCGARGILVRPVDFAHCLVAVQQALESREDAPQRPRDAVLVSQVLLVTNDAEIADRATAQAQQHGWSMHWVQSDADALQVFEESSPRVVLRDTVDDAELRTFVMALRGTFANADVPVLALCDQMPHGPHELQNVSVRPRQSSTGVLAEALLELLHEGRQRRAFVRYDVTIPVWMRFGGRVLTGRSVNASRGGLLVSCEQTLSVGSHVGVSVRLADDEPLVDAHGVVAWLETPLPGQGRYKIGIELRQFSARGERAYLGFLRGLTSPYG